LSFERRVVMGTLVFVITFCLSFVLFLLGMGVGRGKRIKALVWVGAGLFLAVVFSPFYVEYTDKPNTRVVSFDKDGNVERVSEVGAFCWSRCTNISVAPFGVRSAVQPITDNLRVRRLTYEVMVAVEDPKALFKAGVLQPHLKRSADVPRSDLDENSHLMSRAVRYYLYEFNNDHSKDLVRFYNPFDQGQRKELEAMLRSYLDPRLKQHGIRVERLTGFEIE
jgi:hypothetical protein